MLRCVLIALALALTLTGPALAQQPDGVVIDPGSPTGKEYAIPLEDARDIGKAPEANKTQPQYERTAPLFGEGIDDQSPGAAAPSRPAGSSKAPNSSKDKPAAAGSSPQPGRHTAGVESALQHSTAATATTGGSALLPLGGGALLVLLAAGAGFVLRLGRNG